jgi:hypothetical protein
MYSYGIGGKDGNGGDNIFFSGNLSKYEGGAGGGFKTDGTSMIHTSSTNTLDKTNYYKGISFLNGGNGGIFENGNGGFGGGSASSYRLTGSGGGYSGGGYSCNYVTGAGGGSYSSEKINIIEYNNGMGYVNIKCLIETN